MGIDLTPTQINDASGVQVTSTWTTNGEYAVSLLVYDPVSGFSDMVVARVAVLDLAPVARLSGPTNLVERGIGTFAASNSVSSPDRIVAFEWD